MGVSFKVHGLKVKWDFKNVKNKNYNTLYDKDLHIVFQCRFYLLASDLYCRSGAHADYYRAALRYLGCTEVDDMDAETKSKQAFYLGLAALLGDGIYNFGELVRWLMYL